MLARIHCKDERTLHIRDMHGNGEDWDHMSLMAFPREWA